MSRVICSYNETLHSNKELPLHATADMKHTKQFRREGTQVVRFRSHKAIKERKLSSAGRGGVEVILDSIFKGRDITLPTKVRLAKAMVFPVVSMDVRVGL